MSADPRESTSPSEYRAKNPYKPPPPEYKPPSLLAEYKYLALAFSAVLAGFLLFGWHVLRHAPARPAAVVAAPGAGAVPPGGRSIPSDGRDAAGAAAPIYIEAIPEKEPR
jgi:hypothetical protein